MTVSEFKQSYTEINPNANVFNLNNDAERMFSFSNVSGFFECLST
jgi:hypothetical protein